MIFQSNNLIFLVFVSTWIIFSTSAESRQKRVIGGTKIQKGEWPWLVHLKGKIPSLKLFGIPILYKNYYCGASLINSRWLMTAAHCFTFTNAPDDILKPEHWHAKLGEIEANHDIVDRVKDVLSDYIEQPDWKMWFLHAEKIIMHPQYDAADDWIHDIALVKLEEEIPLDSPELEGIIGAVGLPMYDQGLRLSEAWPVPGTVCVFNGWGCTSSGGPVTNHARSTYLPIMPHYKCIFRGIGNTRLCAGYYLKDRGICAGDSGAPLVCNSSEGLWVQAGLASYTSRKRPGSVPGVFTRIANYIPWIGQVLDTE